MPASILIFEPDTPVDAETYRRGLASAFPDLEVRATSDAQQAHRLAPDVTVLIAKAQHVSRALVEAMPRLQWIQALTTGIDPLLALNLPPSVIVTSARGIHGPQMAELTMLLMMSLYRDFPRLLANQRVPRWERWGQRLLAGKTVVIVGVGSISEALAARCRPFGLRIVGIPSRPHVDGFDEVYPRARLREAASRADFLVLVIPYSPETHHLVDASVLAAMKPDAFLINVARGSVVDEAALVEALRARRIAGAGLDVFEREPLPLTSPLWSMDNVIVTPHIGGMSDIYAEQLLPVLIHNLQCLVGDQPQAMQNRVSVAP